ncbi:Nicotinamide-nucleotide adenylyltransferase [Candidatus Tiddalikarchaeum anstoanum]|nr:Nicotinamide-nucleotide adenylyltransferase [Candidatus Tiddalikarchaeum anstoanum]
MTTAAIIGRFQPLHNGHLELIKQALKENDKVVIVIGSSNKAYTNENPFTAEEREDMIRKSVKGNYEIIQVPDVPSDDEWIKNVEEKAGSFDTVYTGNTATKKLFQDYDYPVSDAVFSLKLSATDVRALMYKNDKKWEELVPKGALKVLKSIDVKKRIKQII